MGLLLDTSVLIEAERRRIRIGEIPIERIGQLYVSAISVSELLHGQHRAHTAEHRAGRAAFFEQAMLDVEVLNFDYDVAVIHARVWAELRQVGLIIGADDLMVAATALHGGHTVVTHNVREFSRVPGLDVISPGW